MPGIDLDGSVALVTGASRGIGAVIASRLAKAGVKVGVNYRASRESAAVVVEEIAEAMNRTAAEYPAETNEFEIAGLTEVPSDIVAPPRVGESPVNMECRLDQVVTIGSGDKEHGLIVGEILLMHIRDDIISGHRINHDVLKPVGRLAGNMYCYTHDTYQMVRPVYKR